MFQQSLENYLKKQHQTIEPTKQQRNAQQKPKMSWISEKNIIFWVSTVAYISSGVIPFCMANVIFGKTIRV